MSCQKTEFRSVTQLVALALTIILSACSGAKEVKNAAEKTASSAASAVKSAVSGGGEFEGEVVMKMETAGAKGAHITYFIKDDHSRIEMQMPDQPGLKTAMLMDMNAGKMTTLMPAQKMYMTIDIKAAGEEAKKRHDKADDNEATEYPRLTPTGNKETIAGYECEHWLMGEKQEIDMCVAKGLGYFGMGGGMGRAGALKNLILNPKMLVEVAKHPEWMKLLEGGAFPLKITVKGDDKEGMTMEATKIEKKSLDAALFTIPADYKEMKLPGFMSGGK